MIITCEKCSAKYSVPDNAVPDEGRNVRCSKCNHEWFIKKPSLEKEIAENISKIETVEESGPKATEEDKIEQTSHQLTIVKQEGSSVIYKVIIFLIIILTLLSAVFYRDQILKFIPSLKTLYRSVHIDDSSAFVFKNITFNKVVKNGITNILINGYLLNNSKDQAYVPLIKITLLDKNKKAILSHMLDPASTILKAGDSYNISNNITNLTSLAEYINLDIGNELELLFRP